TCAFRSNHTKWREDASNQSDKYLRNSIRHNIVPLLKELTPDFLNSFSKTTNYLQEVQAFSDEVSEEILNELSLQFKDYSALKINDLTYYKNRSEEHTSELQSRENLVCRL